MAQTRTSVGGSAMQGGADYQNRVAAWFATKMLAERDALPLLPAGTVSYLRAETRESVDDLLVATDQESFAFVQAKRKISLSALPTSELASVFSQCVRQFVHPEEPALRPWSRALDVDRDRFLLITSSDSPETLRNDLARVLERAASLVPRQTLNDAALSQKEIAALNITVDHVKREWKTETGNEPTEEQSKTLLSLLRVVTLDVEVGGVHEREAIGDLRAQVLTDVSQEHLAWKSAVDACKQTALLQSGVSLSQLRKILLADGIRLQHERAYRSDIAKLEAHSASTLGLLEENSAVKLGSRLIKVPREVVASLSSTMAPPSFVIVGPPGAGKSGVLHDLAVALGRLGNDVVCMAVDRLELSSAGRLREEIGLSAPVVDVLRHWDGKKAGYLIIDAFDAARGDTAAGTLLDLIQQTQLLSRWKVIVTVRKYDLRYSPRLRKLFPSNGLSSGGQVQQDSEFSFVSHIRVDAFTPNEFKNCCAEWGALGQLAAVATDSLVELLHTPFNLRLAAELLDSGRRPEDFAGLYGQTGLLKAYWELRVESSRGSEQRERVLRQCVDSMVVTRRLRTERQTVTASADALEELLKSNVLSEWQASPSAQPIRQLISFSHNLLFDFAAERVYLPYEANGFIALLLADPDLAIVLRPSLHMRFRLLWDTDRDDFWKLTFQLCGTPRLSPLIQSVPLTVVAEAASKVSDLFPLSQELMDGSSVLHQSASLTYRHLVGILTSGRPENLRNLGPNAGAWSTLAVDATQNPEFDQIVNALSWIESSFNDWDARTPEQLGQVGLVARRVLSFAWGETNRNSALVAAGIRAVCKTFESDVVASGALLRNALGREHMERYGHEELRWIVHSVSSLLTFDPAFVASLYKATFGWREEAEDKTAMGAPSKLIGFTSTRRQDYQQSLWELGQRFPALLAADLTLATDVIVDIVSHHAIHEHRAQDDTTAFVIDGIASGLRTDYSGIWGQSDMDGEPIPMFRAYIRHLDESVLANGNPLPRNILEMLIGRGGVGVLWRNVLELALKHDALRYQIRQTAWTRPLLVGYDTEKLMFRLIQAAYPSLSDTERELVEDTIMDIPLRIKGQPFGRETRDRYLGALEGQALRTSRAKRQQSGLRNAKVLRQDAPEEFQMQGGAMPMPPPEILYGWRGVDVENPVTKGLIALQKPLREFNTTHMQVSAIPASEAALALFPDMTAMWCALGDGGSVLPNEDVLHESFALLIQAAAKMAPKPDLKQSPELFDLVERILVTGTATLWPEIDEEKNSTFDAQGGWGSPTGRVEAAEGLFCLIVDQGESRLLEHRAFERILKDPSALVRSRISSPILRLYEHDRDSMWKLIDRFAFDKSVQVRQSVVLALSELAPVHPERAVPLMVQILERIDKSQKASENLRHITIQQLTRIYVWRGDITAEGALLELIAKLPSTDAEARDMTFALRHGMMAAANEHTTTDEAERVRECSVRIFTLVIDAITIILEPLNRAISERRELNEDEGRVYGDMMKMALSFCRELYFAVGAFQENRPYSAPVVETPEQVWLYKAIGDHWDKLASLGEAQIAHSLTQSLEMFISIDPERVFLRVGEILRTAKAWGYQYEQLGFDLVLRIFSTYLAEHPEMFQTNPECLKIMRETLEIFVNAGWAAARNLSYRLDDLFR